MSDGSEFRLLGKDYLPGDVIAKVTGQARYAEDIRADGMLFVKLFLSPMPHARVRNIDARAALAMDGVFAVLTADDVPARPAPNQPILTNEPLYAGEPILAVAAIDEWTAAEALERIRVDLEPLPFVIDPLDSLHPGGPDAHSGGNVTNTGLELQTIKWTARDFAVEDGQLPMGQPAEQWAYGDLDAGFAQAALVLDESFVTQAMSHHSMEPRSAMAYWENGRCYLYGSLQSSSFSHPLAANLLGINIEDLVLISETCGGGFGSKANAYPSMVLPALMARKTGRPCMLRISRAEEYYLGYCRAGFQGRARIGFRADGRITAMDLYIIQANGPYTGFADFRNAGDTASLLYQPLAMRWRGISVRTNTPPTAAQRGPGENQTANALERYIDKAARELGLDRVAIRRLNAPDNDGLIGANRGPLTSAYLRNALDIGAERFGWTQKLQLSGQREGSKLTGVGVGIAYHSAGLSGFDGLVRIDTDGVLHIHTGVGNLGTYSYDGTARVAAEILGCEWENCIVHRGDTSKHLPWNAGQFGSNTTNTMSRTNYVAAMDAKRKLAEIASAQFGGSPEDFETAGGRVFARADASRGMSLGEAASRAIALGGEYSGEVLPEDLNPMTRRSATALAGTGLIGVSRDNLPIPGTPPALTASFVKVQVDTETGKVTIQDYLCVADCGRVMHPKSLGTQLHGGAVQGFGMALMERHVFDPQLGREATRGLYTAKPPTYLDVPLHMDWAAVNIPDPVNPVGARGVGEPPMGSAAAAVTCAIADAMGGHMFNRSPIVPDMIVNAVAGEPQSHGPLDVYTQ